MSTPPLIQPPSSPYNLELESIDISIDVYKYISILNLCKINIQFGSNESNRSLLQDHCM